MKASKRRGDFKMGWLAFGVTNNFLNFLSNIMNTDAFYIAISWKLASGKMHFTSLLDHVSKKQKSSWFSL